MKVLIINGSPRKDGNCARLIREAAAVFDKEGVSYELFEVGNKAIRGCAACDYCVTHDACVFNDEATELGKKLADCDGLLLVSPVYYASANGTLVSLLDRMFRSIKCDLRMKVGAAFAVARRAGTVATFDELNKYFTINQMVVASGDYWNNGFGGAKGEIEEDAEGLRNARVVAQNMVFLMRAVALGKEKYGLPENEPRARTSFIR